MNNSPRSTIAFACWIVLAAVIGTALGMAGGAVGWTVFMDDYRGERCLPRFHGGREVKMVGEHWYTRDGRLICLRAPLP
jgi:hypothetical protein